MAESVGELLGFLFSYIFQAVWTSGPPQVDVLGAIVTYFAQRLIVDMAGAMSKTQLHKID